MQCVFYLDATFEVIQRLYMCGGIDSPEHNKHYKSLYMSHLSGWFINTNIVRQAFIDVTFIT